MFDIWFTFYTKYLHFWFVHKKPQPIFFKLATYKLKTFKKKCIFLKMYLFYERNSSLKADVIQGHRFWQIRVFHYLSI